MAKTIFYSLAALVRKILFCHSKIKFISSRHRVISSIYVWCQKNLVCWPNRAFLVRGLARVTALCFWARPLTLTVPLSTQVYKWVPANLMLGGDVSYFAWRHSVLQSDVPCKTEVPFSTKQAKKTAIVWKLCLFFTTSIRYKLSRSFCLCLWCIAYRKIFPENPKRHYGISLEL